MPSDMKISDKGLQTLIDSEGSEQETYIDQAGLPTIGVGHCLTRSEISSGKIELSDGSIIDMRNNRISQTNIKRLLQDDLISREKLVNRLVKVPLAQGQFDALVHFVFNVGNGAFKNSTLLKKLNRGDYSAVSNEMRKWNIVTVAGQKQVSDGLANRREVECAMWESCEPEAHVKRKKRKKSSKNNQPRQRSESTVKSGSQKPVYKSKVIGAAIATAAAYLVSKFGIEIPAEYQATLESSIVLAGLAGIGILRKWFTNTSIR